MVGCIGAFEQSSDVYLMTALSYSFSSSFSLSLWEVFLSENVIELRVPRYFNLFSFALHSVPLPSHFLSRAPSSHSHFVPLPPPFPPLSSPPSFCLPFPAHLSLQQVVAGVHFSGVVDGTSSLSKRFTRDSGINSHKPACYAIDYIKSL